MRYSEAIDYLYTQLPLYQRRGARAYKPGLDRILRLLEHIDHPQLAYPCLHIAGTNGKGSVSHMLSATLQAAGYRVGLYTSPHYRDFRERIKVSGVLVTKRWVAQWVSQLESHIASLEPSSFELSVAMAFDYFRYQAVDIAVIETGLGGRLDSTNVLTPLLSIITNISMDHVQTLGPHRSDIAREKAGIIKPGVPCILGLQAPEILPVIQDIADKRQAPLILAEDLSIKQIERSLSSIHLAWDHAGSTEILHCDVSGNYQLENIRTCLASLVNLPASHPISLRDIKSGLSHIRSLSNYIGRYQIIGQQPMTLIDAAHNAAGLESLLDSLRSDRIDFSKSVFILGRVEDKSWDDIWHLWPREASYYFTQPRVPRAMKADKLMLEAESHGLNGKIINSVPRALAAARARKGIDYIVATGSSFIVAELV